MQRFGLGSFKVLGGGLAVVDELAKGATATATASVRTPTKKTHNKNPPQHRGHVLCRPHQGAVD